MTESSWSVLTGCGAIIAIVLGSLLLAAIVVGVAVPIALIAWSVLT